MRPILLVHFGELFLKGRNRSFFERLLLINIRRALKDILCNFKQSFGRFEFEFPKNTFKNMFDVIPRLQVVPGISTIFLGLKAHTIDMKQIKKCTANLLKNDSCETFAVRCRQSNPKIKISSREIEVALGDYVRKEFKVRVDLDNPDCTIYVFLNSQDVYVCTKKFSGRNGLPVAASGKVLSLISGGIDSPVASYMMQTRGASVHFLHFHSYPLTDRGSIEKVKELVKKIQEYQPPSTVYLAPLADLQKKIVKLAPAALRVVLYRRAMMEIAQEIAKKNNLLALVTGEALGQVASQTLENIIVATNDITLPIFRPLIGTNKEEIVRLARLIGTYDLSIREEQDCCSLMLPATVVIRVSVEYLNKAIKKIPWLKLKKRVIEKTEKICI